MSSFRSLLFWLHLTAGVLAAAVIEPAATAAGVPMVPAALTCPTPGRYGVQSAIQVPDEAPNTPLTVASTR